MENEKKQLEKPITEMYKQKEIMADGKRYIIFYTFGEEGRSKKEVTENV